MKIVKRILGLSVLLLMLGTLTRCTDDRSVGPAEQLESVAIMQSAVPPPGAHWMSDYFPLEPHKFGIRTYYSYDEDEYYTMMVTGMETVPYTSGPIEATMVLFGDEEIGMYVDGRELWWPIVQGEYYLSRDCALTGLPTEGGFGKVWDGLYLDFSQLGAYWFKKDGSECDPTPEDTEPILFKIDDVDIAGQKHTNALVGWSLELYPYQPLSEFDPDWGITLPTSEETRGNAVDGFVIFAFGKGLVVLGETDLETGQLDELEVLVSKDPLLTSSKLVFMSLRDDPSSSELYVMNADGSGQTRLTNDSDWEERPRWSPDGKRIAFTRLQDGSWDIWVMNEDGSGQKNLTNSSDAHYRRPDWSPNGKQLVFDGGSIGSPDADIYVMNADGSGLTRLTDDPAFDGAASFSPNGKQITFMSRRDDGDLDIYVMNADGSGVERLTDSPASDGAPRWSPNGKQIAFRSDRDGDNEVWIMNADGSGKTNVTDNEGVGDVFPSWSPNGREIAFGRDHDGNMEVYVISVDGSGLRRLTYNPAWDGTQDWTNGRCKSCR